MHQLNNYDNLQQVEKANNNKNHWTICLACKGQGKKRNRIRKKVKLQYQIALDQHQKTNGKTPVPTPPKGHLSTCSDCKGSGLIRTDSPTPTDKKNYPQVAIIGGGIGGVALAVACLHRGIPFTIYERDTSFNARSQGYGLTLQQASKAMEGFGIPSLNDGIVSTRHIVHNTKGEIIGEWGMRKWLQSNEKTTPKRTNIHIARQSLRRALIEQLGGHAIIKWGHQLMSFKETEHHKTELNFKVNGEIKTTNADVVIGADGIRSTVRKLLIGEEITPLRYLDCMVILGICSLESIKDMDCSLLDSETVFQTANGKERIYMMPFTSDTIMWQLSFPISENEAKELSAKGTAALKKEACFRTPWHAPIPQILAATLETDITGYPVYDRELLTPELFKNAGNVTLLGDAAHPMSPFKGQGANQALLDALSLVREIHKGCRPKSNWREVGIRKNVLNTFEEEMMNRSTSKVKDSAEAAQFLHSEIVLHKADEPRGRILKRK